MNRTIYERTLQPSSLNQPIAYQIRNLSIWTVLACDCGITVRCNSITGSFSCRSGNRIHKLRPNLMTRNMKREDKIGKKNKRGKPEWSFSVFLAANDNQTEFSGELNSIRLSYLRRVWLGVFIHPPIIQYNCFHQK